MESVEDRSAVVIGGGGGVGGGIAIALAEAGAKVMVADIHLESAESVAGEIAAAGGHASAAQVDSTNDESLLALCERTVAEFGGLNVLSNQCGVIKDESVIEATDDDWNWHWEFNVMTMIRSVRTALPFIRESEGGGHIVTTSSMAGVLAIDPAFTGGVNTGLYTTTKHAVVGYSDMLRAELEPEGIGVTVLCPGLVEGKLGESSARNRPERFGGSAGEVKGSRPMPEGAMPREVAGAAVLKAIMANRAYCFTHPEVMPMITARYEARRADAEAATAARS